MKNKLKKFMTLTALISTLAFPEENIKTETEKNKNPKQ